MSPAVLSLQTCGGCYGLRTDHWQDSGTASHAGVGSSKVVHKCLFVNFSYDLAVIIEEQV